MKDELVAKAAVTSVMLVTCIDHFDHTGGLGPLRTAFACLFATVHAQPGLSMGLSLIVSLLPASALQTSPILAIESP